MQHLCYTLSMDVQNCDATRVVHSRTVSNVPALSQLKELRVRAAMSQADLADASGVARTTIVRLEGGDPNVKPSTLRKLAAALKVKPARLIG